MACSVHLPDILGNQVKQRGEEREARAEHHVVEVSTMK